MAEHTSTAVSTTKNEPVVIARFLLMCFLESGERNYSSIPARNVMIAEVRPLRVHGLQGCGLNDEVSHRIITAGY
jgi:hypothetical protein